jgi:pimeloyl-ACP methyl ester carboxylesterase
MARRIPSCELVVVERCGHMSPMEQPAEVSAALAHFLSKVAPS